MSPEPPLNFNSARDNPAIRREPHRQANCLPSVTARSSAAILALAHPLIGGVTFMYPAALKEAEGRCAGRGVTALVA